jgi:GNAT superfamily N-acetyltransferase
MTTLSIRSKDCIQLRSRILRPGQNIELCHFQEDEFENTLHLGIFINDNIVSVGTFIANSTPLFSELKNPYRLRGMATDLGYQGQGFGRLILQDAEKKLCQRNCELLWCNARESAFSFYEKCGFNSTGEQFDIAGVGPHKVMFKKLTSVPDITR